MSGGSGIVTEMKRNFGNFMTKLGAHVIHLGYNIVGRAFDKVRGGFSRIATYIREKSRLKEYLINTVTDLKHKKKSIEHFLFWLYEDVEAKRANEGPFKAAGLWIGRVSRKLWHLRGGLVTIFNWVAPVVSLVFMFSVINSVSNLAYGVSVEYNGQSLGMLGAESDYDEAEKVLQDRIMYVEGNEKVTIAPKLSVQLITDEQEIVDSEELVDKILINTDVELTEACGVYIDGEFLGAVESKQAVESVLSRILSKYRDDGVKSVAFEKDVQLSEGLYLKDSIVANDEVLDIIMSDVSTDVYYEVQKGDTPIKIASMAGIPLMELRRLNPDIDNNMKVGDTVTLNVAEPYMSVNVVKEVEYTAPVPYDTVTSESDLVYQGDKRTVVEGVEGEAVILADVTTRNGIEVSRTVLEETIVVEPVTEEIQIGTKTPAPITGVRIDGTGKYSWPVAGGYISAYMGDGRGHKGIDIAAPYGTSIFAADIGTVIQVESLGYGYGKHIKIRHEDGTITHYAHCSAMFVEVGQVVAKGEPIAAIGSTGDSTGNHLHFEVISNGVFKNPMDYVK